MASSVVSYVRAVKLTLTPRCVNRCGFCPYPLRKYHPAPSPKRWRQWLRQARVWEPTAVHLTAGEPITKDRDLHQTVRYYGFEDPISYLQALLSAAQEEHLGGHLVTLELGELRRADLQRLRPLVAEYVVGIVAFDPALFNTPILWNAPGMAPPRRLDLLQALGQLRIPTTVNLLVGLGESESSRFQTLAALAEIHARGGHLQHVRISPFQPRPGTPLEAHSPTDPDLLVRTVRQAAEILGAVPIQVPALRVASHIGRCVDAGAQDLGEIAADPMRDMTALAKAWGQVERQLRERGHRLVERLALTEASVARGLYPDAQHPIIARQLDRLMERHVRPVEARRSATTIADDASA